jgi:hypothetical protein
MLWNKKQMSIVKQWIYLNDNIEVQRFLNDISQISAMSRQLQTLNLSLIHVEVCSQNMRIDVIHGECVMITDIGIIAVVEDLTMKVSYQSVQESHMAIGGTGTVPMETNVTRVLSKISTIGIDTRDPADTGEIVRLQKAWN